MITTAQLAPFQLTWLKRKGGRDEHHVLEDEYGFYVIMYSPHEKLGDEKIYLPK